MKTLFTFLFLLLFSINSFSQVFNSDRVRDYSDNIYGYSVIENSKESQKSREISSGILLQKASKSILFGAITTFVGGGIAASGTLFEHEEPEKAMYIAGGVFGVAGIVLGIRGVYYIGRAGKALENEKRQAYLKASDKGIGLAFVF